MNCELLRDHYDRYVLGVARDPERSEIQAHLARGCEVCTLEIRKAREAAALIGSHSALASASAGPRRRVPPSVRAEPHRAGWWTLVWGVAAITSLAMALFAASFFRGREHDLSEQLAAAREQLRNQTIEITRLNEAFSILNRPDTTVSSFGQGQPQAPEGSLFVNRAQGMVLVVSNLPPAAAGKIYQVWLLPKRGMPLGAGLFQSATDGSALYVRKGPFDFPATNAVAVTLENAGGALQPTSAPLIQATLPSHR
jgi:anti-sigma-K factor RskA